MFGRKWEQSHWWWITLFNWTVSWSCTFYSHRQLKRLLTTDKTVLCILRYWCAISYTKHVHYFQPSVHDCTLVLQMHCTTNGCMVGGLLQTDAWWVAYTLAATHNHTILRQCCAGRLLEVVPPTKFGRAKTSKIRQYFWQLSTLSANNSGTDQHRPNENLKSKYQLNPSHVWVKNLLNFGPQQKSYRRAMLTHPSGLYSGDYISTFRGAVPSNFYTCYNH